MRKARTFGDLYIVTFNGMEICPLKFHSRVEAERLAKSLNRAGNYNLYNAVKYKTYIAQEWGDCFTYSSKYPEEP